MLRLLARLFYPWTFAKVIVLAGVLLFVELTLPGPLEDGPGASALQTRRAQVRL